MGPNAPATNSTNLLTTSQSVSKANQSLIEAAPPEDVMPFSRDSSEGSQQDLKSLTSSGEIQSISAQI